MTAGDVVGEIALLNDTPRTAKVRALTPCRLLAIERDEFLAAATGEHGRAGRFERSRREPARAHRTAQPRVAVSGESV